MPGLLPEWSGTTAPGREGGRPGRTIDGRLRDEFPDAKRFAKRARAEASERGVRRRCDQHRPHGSLGYGTPSRGVNAAASFVALALFEVGRGRPRVLRVKRPAHARERKRDSLVGNHLPGASPTALGKWLKDVSRIFGQTRFTSAKGSTKSRAALSAA
jgi:hypothetical protein